MKRYDYDVTFDGLCNGKMKRRKRWRPILCAVIILAILITLALLLGGCVTIHVERAPDGTIYARYERCIFSQNLEGVEIDLVTGKATIMKQQSDAEGVARSVARGFAEGLNPVK